MHETNLKKRFERVEMFLDYMEKEEKDELVEHGLIKDIPSFCGPFIPEIRKYYEREKKLIFNKQKLT